MAIYPPLYDQSPTGLPTVTLADGASYSTDNIEVPPNFTGYIQVEVRGRAVRVSDAAETHVIRSLRVFCTKAAADSEVHFIGDSTVLPGWDTVGEISETPGYPDLATIVVSGSGARVDLVGTAGWTIYLDFMVQVNGRIIDGDG